MMKSHHTVWPFSHDTDGNIHSDGSHGLFNEKMRHARGHVLFAGPEAVNYLSPEFPDRGRCDKNSYVDIPRLLDLATGGRYKWGTATEVKEVRAQLRRQASSGARTEATTTAPAMGSSSGTVVAASCSAFSASGPQNYQPICFERTNVNVCWFQQIDVLRQWWVPAERKRHLGFTGRYLLSFSLETSVPPGQRRAGGVALLDLLDRIWGNALHNWGPLARSPHPATVSQRRRRCSVVRPNVSRYCFASSTPAGISLRPQSRTWEVGILGRERRSLEPYHLLRPHSDPQQPRE